MKTPTRSMMTAALELSQGKLSFDLCGVTMTRMFALGFVAMTQPGGSGSYVPTLTAAGHDLAVQEATRRETAKTARRLQARAMTSAMHSVGMTRTRYGWE